VVSLLPISGAIYDVAFWFTTAEGSKTHYLRGEEAEGIADTPSGSEVDYEFEDLNLHWTTELRYLVLQETVSALIRGETRVRLFCDYETREIGINGRNGH
jgi:hypothetical protein